ncbi:MAG: D-alanyl-D-alanine carboxypeptidase [Bacilli bacterium]|nr:D-alanyl-D-alanine carboxypeptidase [Bacilli bacterium]
MKKICLFLMLFLMPIFVNAEELNLAENAKSAILIEASTGKILYEKNANERLAPASMTKIMSLILIMENIENGNLNWNDIVVVSKNASSMGGSQIFLETNEMMSVEDLVKGICIASGNDATVALAEKIAGTEKAFVKLMNDKAKSLGLKNTNFVNATGLDAEGHYSTAFDMSVMAKELVKHEKILEFSSIYEDYLRKNTSNSFWLVNTNKVVYKNYYSE